MLRGGGVVSPFPTLGSGSDTKGYWVGGTVGNKLIVAPVSSQTGNLAWGAESSRGTTNTTDGLSNTNTLYSFGSAAQPAAYFAKSVSTGGYNTWYLPAKIELMSILTNNTKTPFATANALYVNCWHWSSTEDDYSGAWASKPYAGGGGYTGPKAKPSGYYARAVRRTTV